MRSTSCALALGAALILVPAAAQANFLLNGSLENTVIVGSSTGGFPVPAPPGTPDFQLRTAFAHWAASAYNSGGGMGGAACPTSVFGAGGCAGTGNWVATLEDSSFNVGLPRPVAMYQTVTLDPGAYRFGGDFALAISAVSLGLNASQAFLRIYEGDIAFSAGGVPTGVSGALLSVIDLSPSRFATTDFSPYTNPLGAEFAVRGFETFEDVFLLTGSAPASVTMQLVVIPTLPPLPWPPGVLAQQMDRLSIYADNLFIEATRLQPVPAPGALAVFAVALAGLAVARRRRAA